MMAAQSGKIYRELFDEMPYGSALEDEFLTTHCSMCFGERATIPCEAGEDGCKTVVYCSERCKTIDTPNHRFECVALKKVRSSTSGGKIDQFVRMLGRILTRRMIDQGVASLSNNFPSNVPDRRLSDLISHQTDIEGNECRMSEMTDAMEEFRRAFSDTPLVEDMENVKTTYCLMWINCFSVSGPLSLATGHDSPMGVALYLNVSRFNHSCRPKLAVFFDNARLIMMYPSTANFTYEATAIERAEMTQSAKKFNQMTLNYGFSSSFSKDAYFPSRSQRRASLQFGYFFKCQCVLCADEREAALEEHAAPIECVNCGKPYVWKRIVRSSPLQCFASSKKRATYSCRKTCACRSHKKEIKMVDNYVKSCRADEELKQLEKQFRKAVSYRIKDVLADDIIRRCEPVWELAQSFWHLTANLRMTQLNERLFTAYDAMIMYNWQHDKSRTIDREMLRKALDVGQAGMEWYKNESDMTCDTILVACAYELGRLFGLAARSATSTVEAVEDWQRASSWYSYAASLWKAYGKYAVEFVDQLEVLADGARKSASAVVDSSASVVEPSSNSVQCVM